MIQTPKIGENRTGIGFAPERGERMEEAPEEFPPTSEDGAENVADVRAEYAEEGFRIGSIPAVGIDGREVSPELGPLLDKMGARLAFERAGTRLYDGLVSKLDAYGSFRGGPGREDLIEVREQERWHFNMLRSAIVELGGDPTAMTPSGDLETTVGKGAGDVVADPRTTLLEGLEAAVVAELADHESWEGLIELAELQGKQELVERFREALRTEDQHLEKVRSWVAAGQGRQPTRH